MDTHVINNEKKRLEPIDESHCIFCGKKLTQKDKKKFYVGMYKETGRTNYIIKRSVSYQAVIIGAPRCNKCRYTHIKAGILYNICACLFLFTSIFSIIAIPFIPAFFRKSLGSEITGFSILLLFLIIVVYMLIQFPGILLKMRDRTLKIRNKYIKKRHTLTPEEGVSKYEITKYFLQEGFGFNKPTP